MPSSHHQHHHRCSLHQCLILVIIIVIWGLMIVLVGHIALASSEQPTTASRSRTTSTTTTTATTKDASEKHKNDSLYPTLFTFEQITELIQRRRENKQQRHGDHGPSHQFLSSANSDDDDNRRNCRKCNEHDDDDNEHLSEYLQMYMMKQSSPSSSSSSEQQPNHVKFASDDNEKNSNSNGSGSLIFQSKKSLRGTLSVSHIDVVWSSDDEKSVLFVTTADDASGLKVMLWSYGELEGIQMVTFSDVSATAGYSKALAMKVQQSINGERYVYIVPEPTPSEIGLDLVTRTRFLRVQLLDMSFGDVVETSFVCPNPPVLLSIMALEVDRMGIVMVSKTMVTIRVVSSSSPFVGLFPIMLSEPLNLQNLQISSHKNFLYLYYREFDYSVFFYVIDIKTLTYQVVHSPVMSMDVMPIGIVGYSVGSDDFTLLALGHVTLRGYQAPTTIVHYAHNRSNNNRLELLTTVTDPSRAFLGIGSYRDEPFILLADHQGNGTADEEWWTFSTYDPIGHRFSNSSITNRVALASVVDGRYSPIVPFSQRGFVTFSPLGAGDQGIKSQPARDRTSVSIVRDDGLSMYSSYVLFF